jgi:drug/metabolite transporter (DMT)-like permease
MMDNDEWLTGTVILGISSLILLPIFLSLELKPVTLELVVLLGICLPLEIFAYYVFLSSIRMAALSLTVPLLAFTPALTILTSALLVGEEISALGGVGIALVTIGAYLLNGDLINLNLFAPIKAIFTNPGSRRMLLVAFVWSVTSVLGKKGVLIYGALQFGLLILFGDLIIFILITILRARLGRTEMTFKGGLWSLFIVGGLLMAGAEVTHFISLSMAPVAYFISVKRLSLVFGVILGWMFFREHKIQYRLVGASVMVLGVFFIYS